MIARSCTKAKPCLYVPKPTKKAAGALPDPKEERAHEPHDGGDGGGGGDPCHVGDGGGHHEGHREPLQGLQRVHVHRLLQTDRRLIRHEFKNFSFLFEFL